MDIVTTAALAHHAAGFHEGNPLGVALLAHGWPAFVGHKVVDIAVGVVIGRVGFRWMPRTTTAALLTADALVAVAVANNTYWLVVGHS